MFLTSLRAERQRGIYRASYLFLLLWLGGTISLLAVTYNSYLDVLTYVPEDVMITPGPEIAFNNLLWALIPASITLLILVLIFSIERILLEPVGPNLSKW